MFDKGEGTQSLSAALAIYYFNNMPNHVKNKLYIYGDIDEISRLQNNIKGVSRSGVTSCIDFRKIIPMPALLNIECSNITNEAYKAYINNSIKDTRSRIFRIGRLVAYNVKKYGHKDWYDWCIKEWGTMRNAYDASEENGIITFLTAWNAPVPVIVRLSLQYPTLSFLFRWADEDYGYNCGEYVISNGKIKDTYSRSPGSEEAKDFAINIWNS